MPKDMAKKPYMYQPKDRSGWIFRVVIPARLRPFHADGREFKRALGATFEEALENYPSRALEWAQLHTRLRELADNVEINTHE